MARIRQVKPEFFKSEDVAGLEFPARVLFIGLWTLAAADGRLLDRPRRIAAELFPYDHMEDRIDMLLGMLAARELIVRYIAGGKPCIQIVNFTKHQKPHHKEPESNLPAPPDHGPLLLSPMHSKELREPTPLEDDNVGQNPGETGPVQFIPDEPDTSRSGSLGSGDLENGIPAPRPVGGSSDRTADAVVDDPKRPTTAYGLQQLFGRLWRDRYKEPWVRDRWDPKASDEFLEAIRGLSPPDRDATLAAIPGAIARYLATDTEFYRSRRHPFQTFTKDFNTLRRGPKKEPQMIGKQKIADLPIA